MSRPNVLFVICDQLRADHLGFAGNQVVRTPHIDAIAAGGTVFDRAYVNNPICMPNRSTMMTGLPSGILVATARYFICTHVFETNLVLHAYVRFYAVL